MALINVKFVGTNLQAIVCGNDFAELVKAAKRCCATYDANTKIWWVILNKLNYTILANYMIQDHKLALIKALEEDKQIKPELSFLLPFQVEGLQQLISGKVLLADDVGLGKTLQLFAFAHQKGLKKILVLTPSPLKHQWQTEIKKFLNVDSIILDGEKLKRNSLFNDFRVGDTKYLIANYEQLLNNEFLFTIKYDLIILDEVHRLKNNKAKTYGQARKLLSNFRIGATATPFVNNPKELYNIVNFLVPRYFSYEEFITRYCVQRTVHNYAINRDVVITVGYKNLAELNQRLAFIMCRRHKKDVMPQLPTRSYQEYEVTLHYEQQQVSDRLIEMAKETPDDKMLLSYLTLARLAANSMVQIKQSESPIAKTINIEDTTNSKITVLKEILETINEKVIIFSQWKTSAKEIFDALPTGSAVMITGDDADKHTPLNLFKEDLTKKYLVATDCLNYGLSIPEAHILIHFDLPWSPAKIEQREGRIDRLTQQSPMLIITLTAKDSIEARVRALLEGKLKMFNAVIDGGAEVNEGNLISEVISQLRNEAKINL